MIYILLGLAAVGFFLLIRYNRRVKTKIEVINYEHYTPKTFDYEVQGLINQYRKENGLEELGMNYTVNNVSWSHVKWLTENTPFDEFSEEGHYYLNERGEQLRRIFGDENMPVGENVAANVRTPYYCVEFWKRSAGHNSKMLGEYNEIGLASNDKYCVALFVKV